MILGILDECDHFCVVCKQSWFAWPNVVEMRQKVTWKCAVCEGLVCPGCCLTIPDAQGVPHPAIEAPKGRPYLATTLCSVECWSRAGCPEDS